MRPALLLVSRVLKEKPEFLNAILRIWDYKIVPPQRDTRPYKPEPLKTFDIIQCSPNDPAVLPEVQFLRPIGDKYVSALWKVLARNLRLHIHGNMTACGVTGSSFMDINDRKKTPYIFIVLNANMIFPLLVPGYSQSEKIMSSFYVASTILHELAVSLPSPQPSTPFPLPLSNYVVARFLHDGQDIHVPARRAASIGCP